jgi:hypothetical protein
MIRECPCNECCHLHVSQQHELLHQLVGLLLYVVAIPQDLVRATVHLELQLGVVQTESTLLKAPLPELGGYAVES